MHGQRERWEPGNPTRPGPRTLRVWTTPDPTTSSPTVNTARMPPGPGCGRWSYAERTDRVLELHLGNAPTLSLDRSTVDRPDGAGGAPRPVGPPGDQSTTERLETPPDLREVDRIPAPLRIDYNEALLGVGEQEP